MSMQDILKAAMERALQKPQPTSTNDVAVLEPEPLSPPPEVIHSATTHQPGNTGQFCAHAAPTIKTLADKAMLVKLTRRMFSPYAYDEQATSIVAQQTGINAGRFNKHLFKRPDSLVRKVNSKFTEAYTYHKQHTLPWENGVDLLRADLYLEYTAQMRQRIDACNQAVAELEAVWDIEVQNDMSHLGPLAKLDDYPSNIGRYYSIDVRFRPVPTVGDFRVGISEEDRASLEKDIHDAEQNAARHVIESLLEPMNAAVKRLTEYKGDKGQRFHDSTILNMLEVADRMALVNISDDPIIADKINALRSLVSTYANNVDVLKQSATVRATAQKQINDLMQDMAGLV